MIMTEKNRQDAHSLRDLQVMISKERGEERRLLPSYHAEAHPKEFGVIYF
jgi:ribosomal protein S15P/S13E